MAGNLHVENMAFSAAESALGSFLLEAATGDSNAQGHVLFEARTTGTVQDQFYSSKGERVASGYIDSEHGSDVFAQVNPSLFQECSTSMCGGYSLRDMSESDVGCRLYQIDATGNVGKIGSPVRSVTTTLWAYEVTVCRK